MFLWLQLMMLLTIWSWTMTAWRNEMIRVSLCGKCCLGDFSLRYTIKRMSDARVLIKQIAFGCCYLLFVSHGPLSPNHNFTACLLFQLFGCHTSWTQNPAHKVKLKRKTGENVSEIRSPWRCSNLYVRHTEKNITCTFRLHFC